MQEIFEKFTNTLTLFMAMRCKRHTTHEELPSSFHDLSLDNTEFRFVLIINNYPDDWSDQINDSARQLKLFKRLEKTWKLSQIIIINDSVARDYNLIR